MEEVIDCVRLILLLKVAGSPVVSSLLDAVLIKVTDNVEEGLLLDSISILVNVMVGAVKI